MISLMQLGFSLLEILIVLTIISILAAFNFPSFLQFYDQTKQTILREKLLQVIDEAHQEAQIRNVSVTLCKSKDHHTCSGDWKEGMLVFVDPEKEGMVHEAEQILSVVQWHFSAGTLYLRSYPHYRDYLVFTPALIKSSDDGTFWYCHANHAEWAIILNSAAQTHVVFPDKNGRIIDSHGKILACE